MSAALPPHHGNCFGCGPANAAGLHMSMRRHGDGVRADLVLDDRHEGAPGLAHGGAIASALDDLFGGLVVVLEIPAVTVKLCVEYQRPVPLDTPVVLDARCLSVEGRKLTMQGSVQHEGDTLATADALFVRVELAHFERSGRPLPEEWRRWRG